MFEGKRNPPSPSPLPGYHSSQMQLPSPHQTGGDRLSRDLTRWRLSLAPSVGETVECENAAQ